MSNVTYLADYRPVTWKYIQRINVWSDETLQQAQAEAAFNGFGPAMYLPLDEYAVVQHQHTSLDPRLDIHRVK